MSADSDLLREMSNSKVGIGIDSFTGGTARRVTRVAYFIVGRLEVQIASFSGESALHSDAEVSRNRVRFVNVIKVLGSQQVFDVVVIARMAVVVNALADQIDLR